MSILRVDSITGISGTESAAPIKINGDYAELSSNVKLPPGCVVQTVCRMIHQDYAYSTGGAYYDYFAHLEIMKTRIVSKFDNSAFYVRMGINGESYDHNWTLFPARAVNATDNAPLEYQNYDQWDLDVARHWLGSEQASTQTQYYASGYTNPGNYADSDYNSTPIQTCTMEFIDVPEVIAGTNLDYTAVMQCNANYTFTLNRSQNATLSTNYERGVSYVIIQEISGPVKKEYVEGGVYDYTF